jgi:phosphatidylserine/phosphatidylglycerophosphate/cardiolipin synthase-like enzyme
MLNILNLLSEAAERGVKITIIINDLMSKESRIVTELKENNLKFPHFKLYNFVDPEGRTLHAKIAIADRKSAVVGSANFSWGGMYNNYEIGLFIKGPAVWKLAKIVDSLSDLSILP